VPTQPRSARLALVALAAVLALAGCAPQTVKASTQAEQLLREAGVEVEGVYFNVEPAGGGPDTAAGDRIVQVEITYADKGPAAHPAIADTAARAVWTGSIAHIDTVLVKGPDDHPDASSSLFTAAQLNQRYGPRPAGLVTIDTATLAKEDAEQTSGLLAFVALLPVLFVGGLVLVFLVLVVVVVVVVVARRRRPHAPQVR
jgi:hypothetical protein